MDAKIITYKDDKYLGLLAFWHGQSKDYVISEWKRLMVDASKFDKGNYVYVLEIDGQAIDTSLIV